MFQQTQKNQYNKMARPKKNATAAKEVTAESAETATKTQERTHFKVTGSEEEIAFSGNDVSCKGKIFEVKKIKGEEVHAVRGNIFPVSLGKFVKVKPKNVEPENEQ